MKQRNRKEIKMRKNTENTNTGGNDKKKKTLIIILIIVIAALAAALGFTVVHVLNDNGPSRTAVIEQDNETERNDADETGQLRIKINPVITVKNDTMQNLNFCNYNEGRLLQCKIKVGDNYVYDSGLLEDGSVLKGDFVETKYLKKGENEALAEIYSYSPEEDPIGQTNVKVTLTVE